MVRFLVSSFLDWGYVCICLLVSREQIARVDLVGDFFEFVFETVGDDDVAVLGEGRPGVVARLCMVVDWCIDHPEYTVKIKVIPKKITLF